MDWSDEAVVLSARPHGETAAVAELFTRSHGRHLGLVHGGRSRRLRPVLQTANHVEAVWKARLADSLGHFSLELRRGYAAELMDDPRALLGLQSLAALARLLPERDPHPSLFEVTLFVLGYMAQDAGKGGAAIWPALLVRWELALLEELGFGLDLTQCAATGTTADLVHVSPRSGRAVSRAAGEPYREKLLPLPAFLRPRRDAADENSAPADVAAGFRLTGYFLETRVLQPANAVLPEARGRLVASI